MGISQTANANSLALSKCAFRIQVQNRFMFLRESQALTIREVNLLPGIRHFYPVEIESQKQVF